MDLPNGHDDMKPTNNARTRRIARQNRINTKAYMKYTTREVVTKTIETLMATDFDNLSAPEVHAINETLRALTINIDRAERALSLSRELQVMPYEYATKLNSFLDENDKPVDSPKAVDRELL